MIRKTIGIVGGMGPLATAELFRKLILLTKADKDSEHIHILIDNYPQIPDRAAAILKGAESPVPYILEAANRLVHAGAELPLAFLSLENTDMVDPAHLLAIEAIRLAGYETIS